MSVRHFLTEVTEGGTQLFDHNGRVIEHPDDCLFGKTTGLLLIGTGEDSQLQSFLFHLAQFYNRVNGVDPTTKTLTGQRGHVLEIIVVPSSTAEEESIAEFMSNERLPPFLQIDIEAGGKVYGREEFNLLGGEELALIIVNYDGTVISRQGMVDILGKGDSCLMSWQMKRKNEPVGSGEGGGGTMTQPKTTGGGSRTVVGGVALDLPF